MKVAPEFTRWPALLGAVTLIGTGLALDLADAAAQPFAVGCVTLGAASFGAFLYAEGARHRDWTEGERTTAPPRPTGDEAGTGPPDQGT